VEMLIIHLTTHMKGQLHTLKSVQVRRARTLQALNWASKYHVSRAKVGLLRLKCSGVEGQLANSGNKRPNEPRSSVQWFRELTRTGSAAHTKHETMRNQATLTDRAAMRRYYRPPSALSMPSCQCSRTPVYRSGVNGLVFAHYPY
jgi:hypothetical protein